MCTVRPYVDYVKQKKCSTFPRCSLMNRGNLEQLSTNVLIEYSNKRGDVPSFSPGDATDNSI